MNKGKICVSVCAETAERFNKNIEIARKSADFVELRFDCLNEGEIEKVKFEYDENYIRTFRPSEQGGKRDLTFREREIFWNSGEGFCGGDFEEDIIQNSFGWCYKPVICSYHDLKGIPTDLPGIYERLKATNADVVKIAAQADEIADTIAIWKILVKAARENQKIVPIAMGEAGKWTRILGLAHGAYMTYAALETGAETAPGQISARDLIEIYRVKELDEHTEVYGIVGGNTSYSVSPYIHNAAFKFHRLNAVYVPFEVKNLDEFIKRFVRPETREIELNLKGFSVTIPHKQAIVKHLDSIDETARIIGAVNTVKIVDGKLHGYNTDAAGFIEPLKNAYSNLKNVEVAVIGSGGAARAAIYALKKEGANITVFARNLEKSRDLSREFQIGTEELKTQSPKLETAKIIVNTTPLGTKGALENETPVTAEQIKDVHLAYDLIYNPFETRFLREAKEADVPTIGGLAMLIAQAMAQFEIWTNLDAPMKEMSRAALRKLQS